MIKVWQHLLGVITNQTKKNVAQGHLNGWKHENSKTEKEEEEKENQMAERMKEK